MAPNKVCYILRNELVVSLEVGFIPMVTRVYGYTSLLGREECESRIQTNAKTMADHNCLHTKRTSKSQHFMRASVRDI